MTSIRDTAFEETSADFLPISQNEKLTISINAIAVALSTTLSVFGEALWFITSDVLSGGLGVNLTGALATGVISGVAAVSAIGAIPIAFITYRELNEAEALHAEFLKEKEKREKLQEKIFFELLRLRFFSKDIIAFSAHVQQVLKEQDQTIEVNKLIRQVDTVYLNLSDARYAVFTEKSKLKLYKTANRSAHSFKSLITNPNKDVRDAIISELKKCEIDLDQSFKEIPKPQNKISGLAVAYGVIAGMNAFSFGLSTGWAFGALAIGASVAAAIPVAGWVLLAIGSIAMGISLGVSMGICKQKNIYRSQVNQNSIALNKNLNQVKENIQQEMQCYAHSLVQQQLTLPEKLSPQVDFSNRISSLRAHGLYAATVYDDLSLCHRDAKHDLSRIRRCSF